MKTRIIARYLTKEGYDKTRDRDIELDEYNDLPVKSVSEGREIIQEKALHGNGDGIIYEEKYGKYGWEGVAAHYVDAGIIYRTENL